MRSFGVILLLFFLVFMLSWSVRLSAQTSFSHTWTEIYPLDFPKYPILIEAYEQISQEEIEMISTSFDDMGHLAVKGLQGINMNTEMLNKQLNMYSVRHDLKLRIVKMANLDGFPVDRYRYILRRTWGMSGKKFLALWSFYDRVEKTHYSIQNYSYSGSYGEIYKERKFFRDIATARKGIMREVRKRGLVLSLLEVDQKFEYSMDVYGKEQDRRRSKASRRRSNGIIAIVVVMISFVPNFLGNM